MAEDLDEGVRISTVPSLDVDTGELEALPDRYALRDDDEGHRVLTCVESPNVAVRIERGMTVAASAARKHRSGTIFLDGAAAGEPFMDVQKGIYNLDHHEGCVRAFTLATCEQAMVLVRKGLELGRGDWTVYANEPDLDTALAIWVLLNHVRLSGDASEVREAIMPLVRLEGAIDAHGLAGRELVALPPALLEKTTEQMESLRREENELKASGQWGTVDLAGYTARVLRAIDELVYSARDFEGFQSVEELARVEIGGDRIAVICRSDSGIYEVEQTLARLHGGRVGLVALQKDPKTYSIRLVDSFLPVTLDDLFERLNLVDPAVEGGASQNRWGGSTEIGGSPRATGTGLTVLGIARVIRWVFQPPSAWRRARSVALACALAAAYVVVGGLAVSLANPGTPTGPATLSALPAAVRHGWSPAILLGLALAALAALALGDRRRYGLRRPAGPAFVGLLPVALVAGALGGSALTPEAAGAGLLWPALALPLAMELVFRGAVHGMLFADFRVQRAGGRWFLSPPMLATTVLSTLATALLLVPTAVRGGAAPWTIPVGLAAAALLGLCCGAARERGESLLPPLLLHVAAGLAAVYVPALV